jgi:hypothetical protein
LAWDFAGGGDGPHAERNVKTPANAVAPVPRGTSLDGSRIRRDYNDHHASVMVRRDVVAARHV